MINFFEYYKAYLGINDDYEQTVYPCPIRSKIFCFRSKQPLIYSNLNGKVYFSIAPEFYEELISKLDNIESDCNPDELLSKLDDIFTDLVEDQYINKMYRMSVTKNNLKKPDKFELVEPFSDKHKPLYFKQFASRGEKYKAKKWNFMQQLRDEGRYFVIIDEDQIVSFSYISDIQAGGTNIVVSTNPKFRKKGYGKAVVHAATNWCFKNNLIPIYLVIQSNLASVNLAQSLGYKTMVEEIVVTIAEMIKYKI